MTCFGHFQGHTDEAYCLEGHPTDPRILLSAGHDGNIILWDLQTREQVMKYYNHVSRCCILH